MRAGDVRHVRSPVDDRVQVETADEQIVALRAIGQPGDAPIGGTAGRALLDHSDEIARIRILLLDVATPVRLILADPDLEEYSVAERGCPGSLPDDNRLLPARACLGRTVGDAVIGILTIPARPLLVPENVELVALSDLRRESE